MPRANIAPNINVTQTGSFQFTIVLENTRPSDLPVGEPTPSIILDPDSFSLANVQLNMQDGTVVQNTDPDNQIEVRNYTIESGVIVQFVLVSVTAGGLITIRVEDFPSDKSGSFNVDVTGSVTVELSGVSTSEGFTGSPTKSIDYDTFTSLGASFGKPEYRGGGVLAIPVIFASPVIVPSRTIFTLTHLSGGEIKEFDSYIVGSGREYKLILILLRDASGTFLVAASGTVFKTFSGTYDTVNIKPMFVAWSYFLAEISVLGEPQEVADHIFEVEIETDLPTKSLDINSFSYKIPTESRVLFRSQDLAERPDNPPLVSESDIALPVCFESWERVVDNTVESSGRFFLLRFKREYEDDTHIPEVLFIGGDLE